MGNHQFCFHRGCILNITEQLAAACRIEPETHIMWNKVPQKDIQTDRCLLFVLWFVLCYLSCGLIQVNFTHILQDHFCHWHLFYHDDVIKWKHFPRNWPFVGGIHRSGEFPTQMPVTRSFDVFFDLRLNKRLSKQPWGWWFEMPSWSLWRQCNVLRLPQCLWSNTENDSHKCNENWQCNEIEAK